MDIDKQWYADPEGTRDELISAIDELVAEGGMTKSAAAIEKINVYSNYKLVKRAKGEKP